MTEQQEYDLQILIASGPEALARAALGFAFAVSATVSGAKVLLILTLNGTAWLTADEPSVQQKVNGFDSIGNYMTVLKDTGAVIRLCSACVAGNCAVAAASSNPPLGESSYVGLTEVAIRTAQGSAQTIVF
jgi:predicted peroxiredoxin